MYYQGKLSQEGQPFGLIDGKLAPCPDKPNCVNSEFTDDTDHFIEPLPWHGSNTTQWVSEVILQTGGEITQTSNQYISAIYVSDLFQFVDDVEFRIDTSNKIVQVRSASRVGYGDMNANRNRIEQLNAMYQEVIRHNQAPTKPGMEK